VIVVKKIVISLVTDDSGQTLVETSLIYLFVAIALITSLVFLGDEVIALYSNSSKKIMEIGK